MQKYILSENAPATKRRGDTEQKHKKACRIKKIRAEIRTDAQKG